MRIVQCSICKEGWFNIKDIICQRCKNDKTYPKKFSKENEMIPSKVPEELKNLTQIEEMLIARVFPLINIYHKPRGQRAYKGHVIYFHNDVQKIVKILPNLLSNVPVIKITQSNKEFSKEFRVRKKIVLHALIGCKNIITCTEILLLIWIEWKICLMMKLFCVTNIQTIEGQTTMKSYDLGPTDSFDDDTSKPEQMSSFIPFEENSKMQKDLIDNFVNNIKIELDNNPVNEYSIQFLATMAFPTLFPDGVADPTNLGQFHQVN